MDLESTQVPCPYCGELTEVDLEPLEEAQNFIEDCVVCCHPIQFETVKGEDGIEVVATRSD